MNPNNFVHVLVYTHRHGQDVSVYRTYELALCGACEAIVAYLDEVQEHESYNELIGLINGQMFQEALDLWQEMQYSRDGEAESLEISQKEIILFVDVPAFTPVVMDGDNNCPVSNEELTGVDL